MSDTVALDHGHRIDTIVVTLTPEIVSAFNNGIKNTIEFNYNYWFSIIDKFVSDKNEPNIMNPNTFDCHLPKGMSLCFLQRHAVKEYYINSDGSLIDFLKFNIPDEVTTGVDTVRMDEIVPSMRISDDKLIIRNCNNIATLHKSGCGKNIKYDDDRMWDVIGCEEMQVGSCLKPGIINSMAVMLLDLGIQPSSIRIPMPETYERQYLTK